jgi:hypothetical protein
VCGQENSYVYPTGDPNSLFIDWNIQWYSDCLAPLIHLLWEGDW